jgi:hypothetical protein
MKTINQASKEFAESEIMETYDSTIEELKRISFIYGAKFAQEWISVEDELPPIDELVLAKTVINDMIFYSLDSIICLETDDETFDQYPSWTEGDPTHWRPIERK